MGSFVLGGRAEFNKQLVNIIFRSGNSSHDTGRARCNVRDVNVVKAIYKTPTFTCGDIYPFQ